MSKQAMLILLGVIGIVVIWFFVVNNKIVAAHENCAGSWAQVETVLQRRYDLIPNLVNTVKGYAAHEKGLFEEITRLRSQWGAAKTVAEKTRAAGELEGGLARLLLVAEQYPDLKASSNFRELQYELAGTENRITVERQRYNDAIRTYNTTIRQFPGSVVASIRNFQPNSAYFESKPNAKDAPVVQF